MKEKIIEILKSHSYHHTEGVGVKSQFMYLAEIAFECCADEIMLALDQSQFTADEAEEHINQEVEKRIAERMPSGPKRLFQILDEMNLDDTKNGTRLVSISNSLISADKVKAGTKVAMGADDQVLIDIMSDKCALLLLVIDRKEYQSRSRLTQKTEGGGE